MKKTVIISLIFFLMCLGFNVISKAYAEKYIELRYNVKEIVVCNNEEIEKNMNKKVNIKENEKILLENLEEISIKLKEKNENNCFLEINGDFYEECELQECKEGKYYKIEYNKNYSFYINEKNVVFSIKNK